MIKTLYKINTYETIINQYYYTNTLKSEEKFDPTKISITFFTNLLNFEQNIINQLEKINLPIQDTGLQNIGLYIETTNYILDHLIPLILNQKTTANLMTSLTTLIPLITKYQLKSDNPLTITRILSKELPANTTINLITNIFKHNQLSLYSPETALDKMTHSQWYKISIYNKYPTINNKKILTFLEKIELQIKLQDNN